MWVEGGQRRGEVPVLRGNQVPVQPLLRVSKGKGIKLLRLPTKLRLIGMCSHFIGLSTYFYQPLNKKKELLRNHCVLWF